MPKPKFVVVKCQTSKRLECNSICFAPDSRTILGSVSPNTLVKWDAESGKVIGRFRVPRRGHSLILKYSPDGRLIALAGMRHAILINAESFKIVKSATFAEHAAYQSLDWSLDGRFIALGGTFKQAVVWNIATDKLAVTKPVEDNVGLVAFFNHSGQVLYSCDDEVFLWNPTSKKVRKVIKLKSKDGYCWDHVLSPDKTTLISLSERGCLLKTNTKTWLSKRFKTVTSSCGYQFGFSPDGRLLAMTANIDILHVWDVENGRPLFKWRQPNRLAAFSPVFSHDCRRLACSLDSGVFVLNFKSSVTSG